MENKLTPEQEEKFEFFRKFDNSVLIVDEYVLFVTKSPENQDKLNYFPIYLKT